MVLVVTARRSFSRALLALLFPLPIVCSGCIYARIFYFNIPSLGAVEYFDARVARPSGTPIPLPQGDRATFALAEADAARFASVDDLLARSDTRAFLAVKDGAIVDERYFGGVTAETRLPSFSISKTIGALLIGCAIEDGLIPGIDAHLVELVPELGGRPGYAEVTIDHLLRMISGIDFTEESVAGAVFYYSLDLRTHLYAYDVKWTPGTHYLYGSINTQLLWDALDRRLGGRSVTDWFEERVWARIGAERPASWSLDSADAGAEKLFGGFAATARDHARLGLLFLDRGRFAGRPVVKESWIDRSLEADEVAGILETSDGRVRRGRYQWFRTLDGRGIFAKGYNGQYVFLVPSRRMLFVRFGEGYGGVDWPAFFLGLADQRG
jgi:CubicO group peptidase (beta-lactamase class C family)